MARWLPRITRRQFLATTACAAAGTFGYAWRVEPHWLELVERDLPIAGLPAELVNRTLMQISDVHVGPVVSSDYLIASLEYVSTLEPDIVVITGDFMSCHGHEQIGETVRVLEHLKVPPLGCFAVLGNHDYSVGWANGAVADELIRRLSDMGIRTLRNEWLDVAGLQLVGLDDLWGPHFRPEQVLPRVDWNGPVLTLCHNPDAVDLPALTACRGWILSGHTHGGQCKPPFLPPPLLPVRNQRYTSGEFDLGDGRSLFINRGLGYLRRVRFNVRPEVTRFRLVGC